MSEIVKGVLIGVIAPVILGAAGFVFVAQENKIKIEQLESKLNEISSDIKGSSNSINALKLFVVASHPTKNHIPLASAQKLSRINPDEIWELASTLSGNNEGNLKLIAGDDIQVLTTGSDYKTWELAKKYGFSKEDLVSYSKALSNNSMNGHIVKIQ